MFWVCRNSEATKGDTKGAKMKRSNSFSRPKFFLGARGGFLKSSASL